MPTSSASSSTPSAGSTAAGSAAATSSGLSVVRVSAAIIESQGKLLACHRTNPSGWEFPGGHIEPGETSEEAACREVKEELGVSIVVTGLVDTVEFDYKTFHLSMDCHLARLAPADQEPQALEHDQIKWVGQDELMTLDWLPADTNLIMQLGLNWDQFFAPAHY